MNVRTQVRIAEATMLFGLALLAVGATVRLLDSPFPVSTPVLGVLAVLFVGLGLSIQRRVTG